MKPRSTQADLESTISDDIFASYTKGICVAKMLVILNAYQAKLAEHSYLFLSNTFELNPEADSTALIKYLALQQLQDIIIAGLTAISPKSRGERVTARIYEINEKIEELEDKPDSPEFESLIAELNVLMVVREESAENLIKRIFEINEKIEKLEEHEEDPDSAEFKSQLAELETLKRAREELAKNSTDKEECKILDTLLNNINQALLNPIKPLENQDILKIPKELLSQPIGELLGNRRYSLGTKDTCIALFKGFITVLGTVTVVPTAISYLVTGKRIDQHFFTVSGREVVRKIANELKPFVAKPYEARRSV